MKKESFQGILLGVVIMCAVFAFITVAWAAFSSSLSISGTATVAAQKWAVYFVEKDDTTAPTTPSSYSKKLTGSTTDTVSGITAPDLTNADFTITTSSASGKVADFTEPGQVVTYEWKIKNFGTFGVDGAITGLYSGTTALTSGSNVQVECKATTATTDWTDAKAQTFCDTYIKATLSVNGTDLSSTNKSFNLASSSKTPNELPVKLVVSYLQSKDSSGNVTTDALAAGDISVTIKDVTFTAAQSATTATAA